MSETRERIPAHLRRYVVEQDHAAYDAIDHSVWRFILTHIHAALRHTAHRAYDGGLAHTGISTERIPRIEHMDSCLADFGWGAVCVDGFIPPRAFQEFQAHRILPIAGAIRSEGHLAYTPAPDIVHEAAGHAPIIPDPAYRAFLQRFGVVGARAFASRDDAQLFDAIHALSEAKEDPGATRDQIAQAEAAFEAARARLGAPSEAALLARLHWWTVEYGLVGTVDDYRIYGAGLLSSLGESTACHAPQVRKIPLTTACIDQAYDITRPQPQLYVAESFEQLDEVLEAVANRLAQRRGGYRALEAALASGELATVELESGVQVTGVLERVRGTPQAPAWLELSGRCALAEQGRHHAGHGPDQHPDGYAFPLGPLVGGTSLKSLEPSVLLRRTAKAPERSVLELRFASGVVVRGRVVDARCGASGQLTLITFAEPEARLGSESLLQAQGELYTMAVGERVVSARACPADPAYFEATDFSRRRVPAPRTRPAAERRLLVLYREAEALPDHVVRSPEARARARRIAKALRRHFPDEWLLRWNLLERLRGSHGAAGRAATELCEELVGIGKRLGGDPASAPPIERALESLGHAVSSHRRAS